MSGTIPKAYHDAGKARRENPDPAQRAAPRHALTPCPLPTAGTITEDYKLADANMIRVMETIEACQKHTTHVLSCRKGIIGRVHCRFSCPRGRHVQPTGPIEIEGFPVQLSTTKSIVEARLRGDGTVTNPPTFNGNVTMSRDFPVSYLPSRTVDQPGATTSSLDVRDIVGPCDNRLIVWEMHRSTDDDMRVIEFSPTLTACVASNATVSMLGDKTQAKAVVYYMVNYMTKDSTALNNVLPLIWEAQQTTVTYGSTAPDKAEASRVFKFLTTRILNNLSGRQEISASQAASSLMGYGSIVTSSGFWLCHHEPARQEMLRDLGLDPSQIDEFTSESDDDSGSEDEEFNVPDSTETDLDMSRDTHVPLPDFGESFAFPGGLMLDSDQQVGGGRRLSRRESRGRSNSKTGDGFHPLEGVDSSDDSSDNAKLKDHITFVSPVSDVSHRNALRESRQRNTKKVSSHRPSTLEVPEFSTAAQRPSRKRASPKSASGLSRSVTTSSTVHSLPIRNLAIQLELLPFPDSGNGKDGDAMEDDVTVNTSNTNGAQTDHPGFVEVRIHRGPQGKHGTPKVEVTAQHLMYKFRPSVFCNMSLYEWCGVVDVVQAKYANKSTSGGAEGDEGDERSESTGGDSTGFVAELLSDSDSDSDVESSVISNDSNPKRRAKRAPGAGRPSNGTFSFDPAGGCTLDRYVIKLRSKQLIPIIAGCPPVWPGRPKKTRAWRRAVERYAQAVFATYIPWGIGIVREAGWSPTFNNLCKWIHRAQQPSTPFIDRSRVKLINNLTEGLRVSDQSRKILSKWRSRDADRWPGTRHQRHEQSSKADRVVPGSLSVVPGGGDNKDSLEIIEERLHRDLWAQCVRQQRDGNPRKTALDNFVTSRVSFVTGRMASSTLNYDSDQLAPFSTEEDSTPTEECPSSHVTQNIRSFIVHEAAADILEGVSEAIASATHVESESDESADDSSKPPAPLLRSSDSRYLADHLAASRPGEDSMILEDVEMTDFSHDSSAEVLLRHPQIRENYAKLNANQKVAVDHVVKWSDQMDDHVRDASHNPAPEQLLLFIHGPPGTGKSFVVETISNALPRGAVIITATTGVAASELAGGTTIAFLSGISPQIAKTSGAPTPMGKAKILSLCNIVDREVARILIIDEISMASDKALGQYDSRLTEFMSSRGSGVDVGVLPFGGLAVILIGDGYQLPPVKGTSLIKSISSTSRAPNPFKTMVIRGRNLFKRFRKLELTQQMRAAEDSEHINFLGKLRSTVSTTTSPAGNNRSGRPGQPVVTDSRNLVTDADINRYKILCAEDFVKDESWRSATIVVTSNAERHSHNLNMAKMFAMHYDTPILTWKNPLSGAGANNLSTMVTDFVYSNWSEDLISTFVAGAPAFLTTNINPSKGLANGTKVRLQSITLDPDGDVFENARILARIISARPGELIDLGTNVPLSVNVVLDRLSKSRADNWPESERIRVDTCTTSTSSLAADEVVIPLLAKTALNGDEIVTNFNHCSSARDKNAIKFIRHGFDLGFSVTFYKVQGKTINRVILDLAQRPGSHQISHPALYVGMSRVRRSLDLRLLPLDPNSKQRLRDLRPNRDLQEWLSSFEHDKPGEPQIWSQNANDKFNRQILESQKAEKKLNSSNRRSATAATSKPRKADSCYREVGRDVVMERDAAGAHPGDQLVPVLTDASGLTLNTVPFPIAPQISRSRVHFTANHQLPPAPPSNLSQKKDDVTDLEDDSLITPPDSPLFQVGLRERTYLSNLSELKQLGYLFNHNDFKFLGKCHVTAYDKYNCSTEQLEMSQPAKLCVYIRVIDFLNFSTTLGIIKQLRQLIPHVMFVQNILLNKQQANSCGYVAAKVTSQCVQMFRSHASAVSPLSIDVVTPWNCLFDDACDSIHVLLGNEILYPKNSENISEYPSATVVSSPNTGPSDNSKRPRKRRRLETVGDNEARFIGFEEIIRLINDLYRCRQPGHEDEFATPVPVPTSPSNGDLFRAGSRDICILEMLREMEKCFKDNTPMSQPIIFIFNTDTIDKPGVHWITLLFDIR